ncbi:YheU family protein [Gilvimarinus sp. F26214L]|uniref:YheU family protein n=1 Tax=Gilvimarinus sp. DZF01 TaxID=3461371 RepID=UPI00404653C8
MIIPHERLASETLDSLIESFIVREGTDYGAVEMSFDTKVRQLRSQIKNGEVVIVFDYTTESINLLPRHEVALLSSAEA